MIRNMSIVIDISNEFLIKGTLGGINFFIIEDGNMKLRTYIHLDKCTNFDLGDFFVRSPLHPVTSNPPPPPPEGGSRGFYELKNQIR